ncbi:MAG TPA: zinc metallopeptidase [Candidatus Atribacteria bacterium]|nr:zinc metallopeptidase [Candidatus Atribacteria bacterium]HPT78177.1 zinc metallopeptidase [Candidatus Atribacteria bacterium]
MPFFYYDPTYILLIPAILLALYAQAKVQSTYARYSRVLSRRGITGAQVAAELLRSKGLYDVKIEPIRGRLTDHYDPRTKTLRLSEQIYGSTSLAALGIAAHEVGHAFQHADEYGPLKLRNAIVPVANIGSNLAIPLLLLGLVLSLPGLAAAGVLAFSLAVLFQLITLPVEYNASNRALEVLETGGYLNRDEIGSTRKVLNAAALTYVAATIMAVMQLLRLMLLSGMLGNRRRN